MLNIFIEPDEVLTLLNEEELILFRFHRYLNYASIPMKSLM
ncbi:hypothetical protein [Chryseobacterium sp. JUb7]|nr:hypothetical protein [Chryseobacterium sp. JUb7]MCS3531251.1 hypothetical protein [Chryseobacterium sp. JUb7]